MGTLTPSTFLIGKFATASDQIIRELNASGFSFNQSLISGSTLTIKLNTKDVELNTINEKTQEIVDYFGLSKSELTIKIGSIYSGSTFSSVRVDVVNKEQMLEITINIESSKK